MECAVHVGRKGYACTVLVITPEGKRPLLDLGIDSKVMLRSTLKK
jgi:hypothetical protein